VVVALAVHTHLKSKRNPMLWCGISVSRLEGRRLNILERCGGIFCENETREIKYVNGIAENPTFRELDRSNV